MRFFNKRRSPGFTLIELMIVIAIIGILAAIAVPNFNRARAQAKKKACISNMKTIEGAVEVYLVEKAVAHNTAVDIPKLLSDGYLKTLPVCSSGGSYTITITGGNTTSQGGVGTIIRCSTHQTIDDTTSGL